MSKSSPILVRFLKEHLEVTMEVLVLKIQLFEVLKFSLLEWKVRQLNGAKSTQSNFLYYIYYYTIRPNPFQGTMRSKKPF